MQFDQEDGSKAADISSECSTSTSPTGGTVMHKVSKTDTLAFIAVKYGVTVFDIKAANGLHSDFAMFARDALVIPLRKDEQTKAIDRETMARFVGCLGNRALDPVGTVSQAGANVQSIYKLQSSGLPYDPRESKPLQEIELREHVGYAGSQSGSEHNIFADRIRRRKRDEEADDNSSFGRVISWGGQNIIGSIGRPPIVPVRASDSSSVAPKDQQHSTVAGIIKNIFPSDVIEKVKALANTPALAGVNNTIPLTDIFNWRESKLSVNARSLSDTGPQMQRPTPPKDCPKTE